MAHRFHIFETVLGFIFETVLGFCGIAWSDLGIARFGLPTKTVFAAERSLRRRLPGAGWHTHRTKSSA